MEKLQGKQTTDMLLTITEHNKSDWSKYLFQEGLSQNVSRLSEWTRQCQRNDLFSRPYSFDDNTKSRIVAEVTRIDNSCRINFLIDKAAHMLLPLCKRFALIIELIHRDDEDEFDNW